MGSVLRGVVVEGGGGHGLLLRPDRDDLKSCGGGSIFSDLLSTVVCH